MRKKNIDTLFESPEILFKEYKAKDEAANKLASKRAPADKYETSNTVPKVERNKLVPQANAIHAKKIEEMRGEMLQMKNEVPLNDAAPTELIVAPAHMAFAARNKGKTRKLKKRTTVKELMTAPVFFDEDKNSPKSSNTFLDHLHKVNSVKKVLTQKFGKGSQYEDNMTTVAMNKLLKSRKQRFREKSERKNLVQNHRVVHPVSTPPKGEVHEEATHDSQDKKVNRRRMSLDLRRWLDDVQGKHFASGKRDKEDADRLFV